MAKAVSIYGDAAQGALFFDGVSIPPAPLGGIVVAIENPNRPGKIRVTRTDQFQKDGVTPRVLFKRMLPSRVRNKQNQSLVSDLGFSLAEVISYIYDEANRKANEIDFQKNGSVVGSGNTINFTGAGVSAVTVSGDIATVSIAGGGNPVTSGAIVGAGSTTLRLTLDDSTNVDIDVTSLRSTTAIGSSTAYFFLNNGSQLANNQHDKAGGVVFYGTKVKRGEELVFALPSDDLHIGIWDGCNGVTGVTTMIQPKVAAVYQYMPTIMSGVNTNPYVGTGATIGTGQTEFSLAGLGSGASCIVRTALGFNPDDDNSNLDVQLKFTTNTATQGTGLTNFTIKKEQALIMNEGADQQYISENLFSFFVGSTLQGTTQSNAGSFNIEVVPTSEGELEVLAVTVNLVA